jgi:hypothetical protein
MRVFVFVCLFIWGVIPLRADEGWRSLFNGQDLTGWIPKFAGHELGMNYRDTFIVKDGLLKVDYSKYERFEGAFGHLFYETPFQAYRLRIEYRFKGDQLTGGPGWAFRNNGVMIHSQDPVTMSVQQEFPVSIEVQFLGQVGDKPRPTGNLCTPGTHVVIAGKLVKEHCVASTSPTYAGDGWVTAEIEVKSDGQITHYIEGRSVLTYDAAQLDPNDPDAARLIKNGQLEVYGGYIALQAETHPTEFRKIEILEIE